MKNKTFLKLTLLVLFFVFSCQQEDFVEELQQLDYIDANSVNDGTVITRSNFDNFKGLDVLYQKTVTDQSKSGKGETTGKSGYDFEIDRSRVTEMRIDGNAYYTMPLLGPENEDFSFYNVVVCEYEEKDPEAFLLGYFPDDNYINGLQTGETTRFTGERTLQILDYEKLLSAHGSTCSYVTIPMCNWGGSGHKRGSNCTEAYFYNDRQLVCVYSGDPTGGGPGPGGGHSGDSGFDGASGNGGGSTTSSNLPFDFATEPISHLDTSSYNLLKVTLGITDRDQLHYLWIKPLIADKLFEFIESNSYASPAKEFVRETIKGLIDGEIVSLEEGVTSTLSKKAQNVLAKLFRTTSTPSKQSITSNFLISFSPDAYNEKYIVIKEKSKIKNPFTGYDMGSGVKGITFPLGGNSYEINLLGSFINQASDVEIALVMLHEMLHATLGVHRKYEGYKSFIDIYKDFSREKYGKELHHGIMAENFLKPIATALSQFDYEKENLNDYYILANAGIPYEYRDSKVTDALILKTQEKFRNRK